MAYGDESVLPVGSTPVTMGACPADVVMLTVALAIGCRVNVSLTWTRMMIGVKVN
jgi:hypothetical protein